ncbi:hypothetical protein [Rhizobium sp. BK399]|uniref:hypothetical protein n=1 Tax=Rhizobium sp. BK399 TaxID=2587063 RepID=UPI00160F64B0|nr:hypothetical protein [Rhizobium sp. BK399]MBB3544268.1 DNA-binding response OmpR family regulator [Rhizobium sp. BK399]
MSSSDRTGLLVVEDEPLIRRMLRDELEDARMVVSEARDAADALAVLAPRPLYRSYHHRHPLQAGAGRIGTGTLAKSLRPRVKVMTMSADPSLALPELPSGCRYFAKPYECRQVVASIGNEVRGYVA